MTDKGKLKYRIGLNSISEAMTVGKQTRDLYEKALGNKGMLALWNQSQIEGQSQAHLARSSGADSFLREQERSLAKALSVTSSLDKSLGTAGWINNYEKLIGNEGTQAALKLAQIAGLSQSHLTGITAADFFSPTEAARKMFDASFASSGFIKTMASIDMPPHIELMLGGLHRQSRFLGEFPFSTTDSESEIEETSDEVDAAAEIREEVESRIILVNYFPLRIFDEIHKTPELIHGLTPRRFEEFIADLLDRLGFVEVKLTPPSSDGGRDVITTKYVNDIPMLIAFECKKYSRENKVGVEKLRTLLGTINHSATKASMGVLATTSSFTRGAKDFIATEPSIDGKDFEALVRWITGLNQV